MGEAYFNLKQKLEELGYNNTLPLEAVPLVECILADLLQTTRSLQNYMDLSKEALQQRDSLVLQAEPYKCDNARLIQENNKLHREIMVLKEENLKYSKEIKRKTKALSEELIKKDNTISRLQHEVRDLSLRGLCAETQSSRNKNKKKDFETNFSKICVCNNTRTTNPEKDINNLAEKILLLEVKNEELCDEIVLLKNQVEHRDNEIIRLNILLEGGRPLAAISKDCCKPSTDSQIQSLIKELREIETENETLKKDVQTGLEKQHEAMLRALTLAEKYKVLQEELKKVDLLALKVEEDANKKISILTNENNILQTKVDSLHVRNLELEKQISSYQIRENSATARKLEDFLESNNKENEKLKLENINLLQQNKKLQEKLSTLNKSSHSDHIECTKCPSKYELQSLLEEERKKYEKYIINIQEKMTNTIDDFNKHLNICKDKQSSNNARSHETEFIRDLHTRLCESEQKILMLKKENDEYKHDLIYQQKSNKENYKDVINQLNNENADLSKENMALNQQLSVYKNMHSVRHSNSGDNSKKEIEKYRDKIKEMVHEIEILRKDKKEYNFRYREAMDLVDKYKRDLILKQKEIEHLEEENSSYKKTNRTGRASADHLKEECNFLREQIKNLQSDVIKEKTLSSQIKNIQIETERSTNDIQNELLSTQKKLSLSRNTIETLENKCKELQSEIISLRNDKSNLIDSIKKVDQERDKLIMELDHKTERLDVFEEKLKSATYETSKLENEISELKRKLNINKVSEHKVFDYENQIQFLNGEILRLTQQIDNALMENKRLQNSLADTNGTLKITKIEYEKSRKEVDTLKQQLQHYVAEIRRIEELLSQKEAERSDMLEQFASLSVEANILENTNHSLESESASKTMQLQNYVSKIQSLESKLLDKENIIDSQSAQIAAMACKVNTLENEIKLITEEKSILEQNVLHLKQMCNNLQKKNANLTEVEASDSELRLYENRIKSLSKSKASLEVERDRLNENLATTERLLSNARKEIVELKLALQDATSETKSLQDSVNRMSRRESENHENTLTKDEFELPLMLEEIQEVSHEEDDYSALYREEHRGYSKYSHSSTL